MARFAVFALFAFSSCTFALDDDNSVFSALLLGDWGGTSDSPYTEQGQVACAAGMELVAEQINASIVFLLGDNFYDSGIHGSANDARFEETFEDVYTGHTLQELQYYVVAGNHDHLGNVSAQIEYSKLSPRWNFPDFFYFKQFSWNGNSDLLENKFDALPGPENLELAASQWQFVENHLANSTADYLFTAGHYPVWSGCQHGNTESLVYGLRPLLEKYNATGHLAGHDHCLQYIDEGRGPVYPVSGAGDNCCYHNKHEKNLPEDSLKFHIWNDGSGSPIVGGFASFTATNESLLISFWAANGTKLYESDAILPRKVATSKKD